MVRMILPLIAAAALAGCDTADIKETVGLGRHSPDEFMILTNEPLQVPKTEKLPEPGMVRAVSSNKASPQEQARAALTGAVQQPGNAVSAKETSGEKAFLSQIGAGEEDIRKKVDEDSQKISKGLLGNSITVDVVDSEKELERIEAAKEKGDALTGKDTPTLKRQQKVGK